MMPSETSKGYGMLRRGPKPLTLEAPGYERFLFPACCVLAGVVLLLLVILVVMAIAG